MALARALVADPAVVLADEPTGNLDSESGAAVLALLRRCVEDQGVTAVMVTHDQGASDAADRVIRLVDGHVEP